MHSLTIYLFQGLGDGVVEASSFRTSYVPLNKQEDFIKGMQVWPQHNCPQLPVLMACASTGNL